MQIEQHNANHKKEPISVSVGRATGKVLTNKDIPEIIKEADNLMYSEKKMNHENYDMLFFERFKEYGKDLFD